ncbi:hypothetical protein HDA40_007228 [Hamadaea flava]|uniref:Lipoprotein n=1 Tax=Hamadaea flava TaxID=1742688 RepID=A0ABV8LT85_9ACTN|nr:hypothetical protein [Hamadaea flava]MCP2328721.1 hypothetical protein [Hamadaea flava]
MTRHLRLSLVAAVVVTLARLAGCSGTSPAAAPSPSAGALSEAQIVAILEQHAQCVREHGVAGFQAPAFTDGKVQGKGDKPAGVDTETFASALDACQSVMQQLPASLWAGRPMPNASDIDKLRKFAACMRQNGFPDWPDPDSRGRYAITGTPMEQEMQKGNELPAPCQQYLDGVRAGMTQP